MLFRKDSTTTDTISFYLTSSICSVLMDTNYFSFIIK